MTPAPATPHHVWCMFKKLPNSEACSVCKRLNTLYPEGGLTSDELWEKHFPGKPKPE